MSKSSGRIIEIRNQPRLQFGTGPDPFAIAWGASTRDALPFMQRCFPEVPTQEESSLSIVNSGKTYIRLDNKVSAVTSRTHKHCHFSLAHKGRPSPPTCGQWTRARDDAPRTAA